MPPTPLLVMTRAGLYCPQGDFYIDPGRAVPKALITHAHSDHARPGSARYYATHSCLPLLQHRLGLKASIQGVAYGEELDFNGVTVSFHPAGHILGSAQIRVEYQGEVWVASGDYKRDADPTCEPFEVVPCDVFITESTFALPLYRWDPCDAVAADILEWWVDNQLAKRATILCCYSLGKAQRLLAELGKLTDQPVVLHDSMRELVSLYRAQNVEMIPTRCGRVNDPAGELFLAPPSALKTQWMQQFSDYETGFASGWMRTRRFGNYDRGFVVSDHADWPSLLQTVEDTGAQKIYVMHGSEEVLARHLQERNVDASPVSALYRESA